MAQQPSTKKKDENNNKSAAAYMEEHKLEIHKLFKEMMHELIVNKPADPIEFLINFLGKPRGLRIVIAGAPASGKGTQCEMLVEKYGVTHISTGDLLREAVRNGTELGMKAKDYMDKGQLVPDELMISLVVNRLKEDDCQKHGWLLDGFPRTRRQALELQQASVFPDKFILLDVPDEVVIERISGRRVDPVTSKTYHMVYNPPTDPEVIARVIQRSDDTEEKIKNRLRLYHLNIEEVRECYDSITRRINGNKNKDEVFADIQSFIDEGGKEAHNAACCTTLAHE